MPSATGSCRRRRRWATASSRSPRLSESPFAHRSFPARRVSVGTVIQYARTTPKCQTDGAVVVHTVQSSLWAMPRIGPSQTWLLSEGPGERYRPHTSPAVAFVEVPAHVLTCASTSLPKRRGPASLPGPRRAFRTSAGRHGALQHPPTEGRACVVPSDSTWSFPKKQVISKFPPVSVCL